MRDFIGEQSPSQHLEVGLDGPGRLSLAFSNTEHTFPQNTAGLVIRIGNPHTTPPMLVMSDGVSYCPTGFYQWHENLRWLTKSGKFVRTHTVGRESYSPSTKAGEIDPIISRTHLEIEPGKGGQITVRNMGRNGTDVAEVPMITTEKSVSLKNGAVALDARIERRITLTVGQNNKVELIIGPSGVKKIIGDKVVSLSEIDPQKKDPQSLTLGRDDINLNDKTVSRLHLSIIFDPTTKRYYLFDHSTNGTIVEFAERQNQPQKPPVREEREGETEVRTPRLILKKVGHPEQQIPDDSNSVGGDYYLFGSQLVSPDLLEKGGNAVVVMDTASIQTGGETPATTTKPFAYIFLREYYNQIAQGKDPETAMEEAYKNTYNSNNVGGRTLGKRTEATFTFVTVVGDTAYCLWVGNTEAVVVRKGGSVHKLASSKEMVGQSYYDYETGQWVSPTVLVASGPYQRTGLVKLLRGDQIFIYTDGVNELDPKNPKASSLTGDDVVMVKL